MLEFLDSIDPNQPQFYLQPCTRCLDCEKPIRLNEQKGEALFWVCRGCSCYRGVKCQRLLRATKRRKAAPLGVCLECRRPHFANVGLGSKNQVTDDIVWAERYDNANAQGTPLSFQLVEPQPTNFEIFEACGWVDDEDYQHPPVAIESFPSPIRDDSGFTTLLAAILRYRRDLPQEDIRVEGRLITSQHDLMEALLTAKS